MKIIKDIKIKNNKKIIILDNEEHIEVKSDKYVTDKSKSSSSDTDLLYKKAYDLSLKYLSYRDRTIFEVKNYLLKKNYNSATIESVIQKLIENGLLDDNEYTKKFIYYKSSNNNWGEYKIAYELKRKGVDESIIQDNIQNHSSVDYEKLCDLIKSKYQEEYVVDKYKATAKAIAFLQRKGHNYDLSKKIVNCAFLKEENQ